MQTFIIFEKVGLNEYTIVNMKEKTEAIEQLLAEQRIYFSNNKPSVEVRLELLRKLKITIRKHSSDIEKALWNDLHKSSFETYSTEISIVLGEIDSCLNHLRKWAKTEKVSSPLFLFPSNSYITKESYGLVLIIAPWNYPFQLALAPLITAIAAGNVVALKPSEDSMYTAKVIELIIREVFTEAHVSVFPGDLETSTALLKQRFDYIFFTGSPRTGRIVMEAAVSNLTPVTLELGGEKPVYC